MPAEVGIFEMNWAPTGAWTYTEKTNDLIRFQTADRPDVDWAYPLAKPHLRYDAGIPYLIGIVDDIPLFSWTKLLCLRIKDVPPAGAIYNAYFGFEFGTAGNPPKPKPPPDPPVDADGLPRDDGITNWADSEGTWVDWDRNKHTAYVWTRVANKDGLDPRPPFDVNAGPDGRYGSMNGEVPWFSWYSDLEGLEYVRNDRYGLLLGPYDRYYVYSAPGYLSISGSSSNKFSQPHTTIGWPIELFVEAFNMNPIGNASNFPRQFPAHTLIFIYDEV